jgi:hypothetical protein
MGFSIKKKADPRVSLQVVPYLPFRGSILSIEWSRAEAQ